jgi:ElaB/YqjD/DUF883 family membrane-anchored ribosome-binding protein
MEARTPETHCYCPPKPSFPPEVDRLHKEMCDATDNKSRVFRNYYRRKDSEAKVARRQAKEAMENAKQAFNEAWATWKEQGHE